VKTNPAIYHKDGLPALIHLMSISSALEDPACIHAMVALSLYQVALLKARNSSPWDWERQREINSTNNAATHHVMEAVRLLSKKFEIPKESLSITSLLCAAILGACTVRNSMVVDRFIIHNHSYWA
jgi:hypothetical protein